MTTWTELAHIPELHEDEPSTNGIYLSAVDEDINNPIMSLPPNTAQWTDEISLLLEEAEASRRIYDETQRKNRFCLHVMKGLVDITLSGTTSDSAPFYLSLPFEAPSIALISDFACDTTPTCDVFEQPVGTKTVFNYPNMGQISDQIFIALETQLSFRLLALVAVQRGDKCCFYKGSGIGSKRFVST